MVTEQKMIQTTVQQARPLPRAIAKIMAFKHERLIERFCKDTGESPERASRCFEAFKQFMIVCAIMPGYKVTSDPIDRMWHAFLLFTRDYRAFCEENLGTFIHHEPFEQPCPSAYMETRAFAEQYFGELDHQLWSPNAKADCSSGCFQ